MEKESTHPIKGERAPAFSMPDQEGNTIALSDFGAEQTVVLYFYPRDDTPGCTKEACGFRDAYIEYETRGVIVLGVSRDDAEKHKQFIEKYTLKTGKHFKLLTDADKAVHEAYGAWGEKNLYGKKSMGVIRSTFLIRSGKIVKAYRKVDTATHAQDILEFLNSETA